jgi:hypothetical protein
MFDIFRSNTKGVSICAFKHDEFYFLSLCVKIVIPFMLHSKFVVRKRLLNKELVGKQGLLRLQD